MSHTDKNERVSRKQLTLIEEMQYPKYQTKGVFETNGQHEAVQGLPLSVTSTIKIKKRFPRCEIPSFVIHHALKLMDEKELSLRGIARELNRVFGTKIDGKTVNDWQRRFRPSLVYKRHPKHNAIWKLHITNGLLNHYRGRT